MILEGDLSVINAIKEKKLRMDAGEAHEHIRPLVFIDGGLMKGAYGVGAGLALEELGYTNVFSNVVGVSSGAPSAAYFLAGEVHKGGSLIYEECSSREFLNVWRFWNQVNTKYFMEVFKHDSRKAVDAEKVLASSSNLHIGVAEFKTGRPILINPKTAEELYYAVHASILMPNVSTDRVVLNAVRYADGGFTRPHMLQKVVENIETTHFLYIANQDREMAFIPFLERLLNHTMFRFRMSGLLRKAAHGRKRARMEVLESMKETYGNPYLVVWGDHSISSMERDAEKIQRTVERSRDWWKQLLV